MKPLRSLARFLGADIVPSSRYSLRGNFQSWQEASRKAVGYQDAELVAAAVRRNREERPANGQAFWRDREIQIFSALSFAMERLAPVADVIRVLDFGGEMGALHRLYREAWKRNDVRWTVLETPAMSAAGKANFEDPYLQFTDDPERLAGNSDILIASGVLQCLENPSEIWSRIAGSETSFVILTIFPTAIIERDALTVRGEDPSTGLGDYPLWVFSSEKWLTTFRETHEMLMEWKVDKSDRLETGEEVSYSGFLMKKITR